MKRKILIILSIFMVILIAGCADNGSSSSGNGSIAGSDTGIGDGTGDGGNTGDGTGEPEDGQEPTKNISIKQYKYINDGSIGLDDIVYIKLVVIGMDNKLYSTENSDTPLTLVNGINKNVKKIFSVGYTAYILTEDNELYGWGQNNYGQLGLGHNENIAEPVKIEGINQAVKEIYSINEHQTIYALTESGEVYSWGGNNYYLLGTGNNITNGIYTPQKLNIPVKIKSLSVIDSYGKYAVFALTETGEIYTWGVNVNGNLGLGQDIKDESITQPILIPNLKNIDKFFDINYGIAPYYYVITKDNTLYYWGDNKYNNTFIDSPKQFQWEHGAIKKISFYYERKNYIYTALTENGEVFLWGQDLSSKI